MLTVIQEGSNAAFKCENLKTVLEPIPGRRAQKAMQKLLPIRNAFLYYLPNAVGFTTRPSCYTVSFDHHTRAEQ